MTVIRGIFVFSMAGVGILSAFTSITKAQIIGTTGAVEFAANPPQNLSTGAWESSTEIRAFNEQQKLTLMNAISVDISQPGTFPNSTTSNLSSAIISAGTQVNSYALHFDVNGAPPSGDPYELTGTVTVDEPILGLIVLSSSLNATNSILGITGASYPNGTQYGLELNPAGGGTSDVVTLSNDDRTVTVDWRDATSADNMRIVTAVPEPTTLGLFAIASIGLLARGYKADSPKVT